MKSRFTAGAFLTGMALLLPTLATAQTPAPASAGGKARAQSPAALPAEKATDAQPGRNPVPAGEAARVRANQYYADLGIAASPRMVLLNPRINLHLDNAPLAQAFEKVFQQTGGDGAAPVQASIDADVATDRRVTVHADNVRLSTALDLLCEAGGVHYSVEMRDGKTLYRVGKTVKPGGPFSVSLRNTLKLPDGTTFQPLDPERLNALKLAPGGALRLPAAAGERRSTFTCPHCKGQATVIRKIQAPDCPKCGRTFQADWQFCPNDGTKRPVASGTEWRYCPLCGKRVEMERGDAGDVDPEAEAGVPVLKDIPFVGRLFQKRVLVRPAPQPQDEKEELRLELRPAPAPGEPCAAIGSANKSL